MSTKPSRWPMPAKGEPIRVRFTKSGEPRYRAVVDVAPEGWFHSGDQRRQESKTFGTITEAREWIAATKTAVRRGTHAIDDGTTLRQLCDRWLAARDADVSAGELRGVTVDGYRSDLGRVCRFMGDRKVARLRPSTVEAFRTWALREGNAKTKQPSPLGGRAVAGALDRLESVLSLAVRDGLLTSNPAADVRRPSRLPRDDGSKAHWTPAQMLAFRDVADRDPEPSIRAGLRLVLCGLRRSEVCGLTWELVDLAAGAVEVRHGRVVRANGAADTLTDPKSKRSGRRVPAEAVQPGTNALLKALWLAQGRPEGGLVLRDLADEPLRPEALSDAFWRIARQAGLPRIKMHAVRHSIGTYLANRADVPNAAAADLLGHDLATFERIYVQRTDDGIRQAAAALGEAFSQAL